jgi:hypothetical protein
MFKLIRVELLNQVDEAIFQASLPECVDYVQDAQRHKFPGRVHDRRPDTALVVTALDVGL